jgi:hypothetical protein
MKNESILLERLMRFNPRSDKSLRTVASRRVLTLSLVALTTFISIPVWAQETSATPAGQVSESTDNGLKGVWDVVVTIRDAAGNPLRSFRAMNMYIRGGQFEEFGVGTPPGQRGPGMGVWQREGESRYSAVLEFFRFDDHGTFIGTQKVARTIELNAEEDSFTSSAEIQRFDINGMLMPPIGFATETATRFK